MGEGNCFWTQIAGKEEVNGNRSSLPEVFCKKDVLTNFANSQENTCARASF